MMMNLFSMFDPATPPFFYTNWISLALIWLILPKKFFKVNSRKDLNMMKMTNLIIKNLKNNVKKSYHKSLIITFSTFMFIMANNTTGILPFIFTPTAHISISMSMALPLWLSMNLYSWKSYPQKMFTHLLPLNTPTVLSPFMVIIESISILIRPITLAIRLSANMVAGHILIHLLSGLMCFFIMWLIPSYIIMNTLLILEISVAIIQSYVFMTLLSLYLNEA